MLLVLPNFGEGRSYNFPLGIAYISSSLKAAGHEVHCINMNHQAEGATGFVREAVKRLDPDLIATGGLSSHILRVKEILAAAKAEKPGIITVGGGGLVTAAPDWVATKLPMDIGVIGEGEETMVELARILEARDDIGQVNGIVWAGPDGRAVRTPERKPNKELGQLPWPDLEGFEVEKLVEAQVTSDSFAFHLLDNPRSVPMVASRSCPYKCTFCFHPTGRVYRQRDLDDFFAELDHLIDRYDINMVEVLDELFAYKRPRLEEFCARIKQYKINWWTSLHVRVVEAEVTDMMRDAGCVAVGYGIENVNDIVLDSMAKKSTQAMVDNALAVSFGKGMAVRGNIIFGDPAETLETANYSLDWWANHRPYQISLIPLQVLPGSPVYKRAVKEGWLEDDPEAIAAWSQNVTRLDDATYSRLMTRIGVFEHTLLRAAPVLRFEESASRRHPDKPRYDMEYECVHCGEHNEMNRVEPSPGQFQHFRFACRHCGAFNDIQNLSRQPWSDPEMGQLLRQGMAARTAGQTAQAKALWQQAATRTPGEGGINLPEESILAAYNLGHLYLIEGKIPEAVHYLALALLPRAFDPAFHAAFAAALMREGAHSAAKLHLDQARLLADRADIVPDSLQQTLAGLDKGLSLALARQGTPKYL
ncbi:hypothetical protein JCM17960_11850 [Magnetospira thiophila]